MTKEYDCVGKFITVLLVDSRINSDAKRMHWQVLYPVMKIGSFPVSGGVKIYRC